MNWLVALCFGLTLFLANFQSLAPLNPWEYLWTMKHESSSQAFLSWQTYFVSPWQWPWGGFPVNDLVVNPALSPDAIPLLAMVAKIILPAGSPPLQYFGIWLLGCFTLQAYWGLKIAEILNMRGSLRLMLAGLLTLSPALSFRLYDFGLCAQWLLLVAIYLSLREKPSRRFIADYHWYALMALTPMIHSYFLPPVLTIFVFSQVCQKNLLLRGRFALVRLGSRVVSVVLVSIGVVWGAGLDFSVNQPVHYFTADVLGVFDSQNHSFFLPGLRSNVRMGQAEGFAFLGFSGLLLCLFAVIHHKFYRGKRWRGLSSHPLWRRLFWPGVLLLGWALGSHIRVAGFWVADISGVYKALWPLTSFQALGRFVWVFHYILLVGGVYYFNKYVRFRSRDQFVYSLCMIQFIDLSPIFKSHWNALRGPGPEISQHWEASCKDPHEKSPCQVTLSKED